MNPTFTWGSFGTKINELKNSGITVFSIGKTTFRRMEIFGKGSDGSCAAGDVTTSVISSDGEDELPELSADH